MPKSVSRIISQLQINASRGDVVTEQFLDMWLLLQRSGLLTGNIVIRIDSYEAHSHAGDQLDSLRDEAARPPDVRGQMALKTSGSPVGG
jgi:uracil DNA glycosylase